MNDVIWKTKYPDTEDNNFDWDKMIYVYDGNSIKVGRFDYHHCSIFIHDLLGEQIDWNFWGCGAWCWKDEFDSYLSNLDRTI